MVLLNIKLCNIFRPSTHTDVIVRVDPAPAHKSLFNLLPNSGSLNRNNIKLEIGRSINPNKNPIADKAIREIHREILILQPSGGPVSETILSQAVGNLNTRYRASGLSAQEMWTQRDQLTGDQLPIDDQKLITAQHDRRLLNHQHSEKSKSAGKGKHPTPEVSIGSLVYIYTDRQNMC